MEHDTDLFQKNYHFFISICSYDKKCKIDEKKFQMSKLICLTYSKACFFQSRFLDAEGDNLYYIMKYLNECEKYKGSDIYKDEELINYFNKNKNQICKNYTIDYEVHNIEFERDKYDSKYEFITDSKLETLN